MFATRSYKVCLHNCHHSDPSKRRARPALRNVEIFLTESNGKLYHFKRHTCSQSEQPCAQPGLEFRDLEDDEWIKFGRALYDSRGGLRQNDVLERYKIAWTTLHNSPPPLTNGVPVDFLPNPAYTVSKNIPWFTQADFPVDAANPQPSSSSDPGLPPSIHDVLAFSRTKVALEGRFPNIVGGLNDGFKEYLKSKEKCKIGAVFILDPKFKVDTKEPDAYYAPVVTHPKDAEAVAQEMGGCMSLSKDQKGCKYPQKRYLCMSWLHLAFELIEMPDLVQLRYMSWERYRNATLERRSKDWDMLREVDLTIGGLNFSMNFMETAQAFGLTVPEIIRYWDSVGLLCSGKAFMWPDPRDLVLTGSKLYINHIVTESARALGHSHPMNAVCEDPSVALVQDIQDGKINGVLKREYSSNTLHIYSKHTKNAVTKFRKAMEDQKKFWSWEGRKICENPKWFIQPYLPSLIYLGEVRAFIVNGIIINIITSTPDLQSGLIDVAQAVQLRPLCNIRLTEEDILSGDRAWLLDPELSPLESDSDNCFEKYALEMLGKLVAADEFRIKRRSQLRIFCRLDVGVFKSQGTGKFQYMVNEITPCHTTGLFMAWDHSNRMEIFFQEMAKVLHFLTSERKRSFLTTSSSATPSEI